MDAKRFRIAFSFASEKRDFVAQVATLLAERFGEAKILYDKFHLAQFSRSDLAFHLPDLYEKEADLIVAVLCPDYEKKEWCGLEWNAIFGLLRAGKTDQVMLTRFERVEGKGLHGLAGYTDLDNLTPQQAATLILERLAINEGLPKDHYTKPATASPRVLKTAIPNNLPRLQYFFGREADLKKIAEALAEDARGWGALIDGPGGIGKTTLAIRAAELVPSGRFRRIIFLSAKERELTADGQHALGNFVLPGYLEMLNAIARELNQSELTKSAETERAEVILRSLREADVLLVLDNLETLPEGDRDQLFAFLNRLPRGCSAIVTSRRRADASAVTVRLDKLDWPAVQELISEIAKHNDRLRQASEVERRALYDETGGNPLLMRWVVGQLGLGRCRTIAAALELLRSAPAENNPLEFIFGDLLDSFTANETKVLAALAHFTSAMEVKFIAELAGINQAAAQGALSDLSSRALVLPDLEERRFALVPMVADFLRRARPDAVTETGNRLEKYAYALIVENGYQKHDRFPVLDAIWPTVFPALPLFVVGSNGRLQTVCDALTRFLEFTGRWDELILLSKQAETRALEDSDSESAGWRVIWVSAIYERRGQSDKMLAAAELATAYLLSSQISPLKRAWATLIRGRALRLLKDYAAAILACLEAVRLFRTLSVESRDLVIALIALAKAEHDSGDLEAAENDYYEALHISRRVHDAEGVAFCTGSLAELALDQEDWLGAETLAHEALPLSEKVGRLELIADDCQYLAKSLVRQGKPAEARSYAQRAVEIYDRLSSPKLEEARAILDECGT